MTITQLLTAVKNLTGEGYQNWDTEVKQAIKSAVIDLFNSGKYTETDYPALICTDSVTLGATPTQYFDFYGMLTSTQELIRFLDFQYNEYLYNTDVPPSVIGKNEWKLNIASYNQAQCILQNADLAGGNPYAYWVSTNLNPLLLIVGVACKESDLINTTYAVWDTNLLTPATPDVSNVNEWFSDRFLDDVIQLSANKLQGMIRQ